MSKRKKLKGFFFIIIAIMLIISAYNFFAFFTKGKQVISVSSSSTYYSGSDINATVSVKKVKNDKLIDAKLKAELYDKENKKIKNVKDQIKIEKGEKANFVLDIPEDLETGNYTLKITSKSGIFKDEAKVPVNIIKDVKSNIIISLDKGIYKPGDEINFRTLILSKKDNTPVKNKVSIYIYDGNNNKVYTNTTETSDYGIVSGKFKLADEVNSGTYKITVVTESQEVSKDFIVNPYITPKFEATITTDKENYLLGETAQITVSGKYFFGEPVKGAVVEGTIGEEKFKGFTNEEGNYVTTYKIKKAEKINLEFNITDTSNYMVESRKNIFAGTDIFKVEVLPEYGFIAKYVDNEIYIITKNIDGTPVKTYSTVKFDEVSKQVISDENGIGKIILTKDEISALNIRNNFNLNIVSEDMQANKVQKVEQLEINSEYSTLIKTDKVKYDISEDIEISVNSKFDSNYDIYFFKNDELLKSVSTENDSVIVNLEDVTGLVDIVIPSNVKQYYRSYNYNGYQNINNYSKRTIFIKPDKKLNIDIKTSADEYKPGDNLNINFLTTNEKNENVDAALLVSILDDAILNLAENDLSIDNIKLALEDIVLDEGMNAADLYTMIMEDSSKASLHSILLKQNLTNPNIVNKDWVNDDIENNLLIGILLLTLTIIFIYIYVFVKYEKVRKSALKIFVPCINVLGIFVILSIYISNLEIFDNMYISSFWMIFLIEFVLAAVIYILFLYKEKDLIFKIIKDFVICPGIVLIFANIIVEIIQETTILSYSNANEIVAMFGVLSYLIIFTILYAKNRKKELKGKIKAIFEFFKILAEAAIFWIIVAIFENVVYEFSFLITLAIYVVYRKFLLREAKIKIKNKKIILNVTAAEMIGMIIGLFMVIIILLLFYIVISMKSDRMITQEREEYKSSGTIMFESEPDFSNIDGTTNSETKGSNTLTFADVDTDSMFMSSGSTKQESYSIFDFTQVDGTFSNAFKSEDSKESESLLTNEIDKDIKIQENVRKVFLESLAFIPELVTKNGTAELDLKISDNITTWSIQTVGNTKDGNIGYASNSFKVFKEFFIDFTLPNNSVVTDKVSIPVTLYNYTENELNINLNVKENDWAKIGEYSKSINIPAKETNMIYIPLEIIKDGNNILRVEASNGEKSDIVEKTIVVRPNGLEKNEVVSSGIIENDYSQDLIFNNEAIAGTEKVKIKVYPTAMAQVIENIEGMLKMPTGCFEQTSSSLYPDILVLKYLREYDLNNDELEKKALEYISKGYQKLLTYEVSGTPGGYSLYGENPAEPVITAFGLMEMKELADVYEVDENVIKEMQEYLFSVQKSNGTFDYTSKYIGGTASTDKLAMNSYIIWALSEVCPEDKRLEKSIEYLKKEMKVTSDTYTLALMANVFVNTENKALANEVIEELKEKVKTTDIGAYVESSIYDYYGTKGEIQNVQATALTSMAFTKMGVNQKTNFEFIKYLTRFKDHRGTWGTTQSTILALKAIVDYSSKSELKEQTIVVALNGVEQKVEIGNDSLDIYEFEFTNIQKENNFSIEMQKGKITYEIIKNYYQPYDKLDDGSDIIISQELLTDVKINDIISQNIIIKNKENYIENGLIEINIPQGCSVIEDSLLSLKYDGIIEKYEYNYEKINIYLREVEKEEQIDIKVEYRALYPEDITGASIRFFDYYNPEIESICKPVNIKVTE